MLDELTFFQRFRVTKLTAMYILELIENEIEYHYDFNYSLAPINQIMIFLRLCATGTHLTCIGDFAGVHYSTVSRIAVRVGSAIARHYNQFVNLPQTAEEINAAQLSFYERARFPRIVGAIDGTHIRIQSPGGEDAEVFRNRKGFFSVNTQIVAGADEKILNLVARWPGSSHDMTIFNNSCLRRQFDEGRYPNCLLLGDNGYAVKPYLLTPLLNPDSHAERLYNEAHIKTRNVVERTIGIWKRRFPILAYGCRLKLSTTLTIIVATAVVYNICKQNGEPDPPDPDDIQLFVQVIEDDVVPNVPASEDGISGVETRRNFIAQYFAHLES
ncbi:unnamed protein product [Callosobruchus maculatus]|uniref:DDE Tnp4 domain-containing protein n=1 Tax=Callosobruchus maculatus TaxID=64391 RepID=A0A653CTF5_CALMS|nr:unnamed protein product [Callosobruchus maculatus]